MRTSTYSVTCFSVGLLVLGCSSGSSNAPSGSAGAAGAAAQAGTQSGGAGASAVSGGGTSGGSAAASGNSGLGAGSGSTAGASGASGEAAGGSAGKGGVGGASNTGGSSGAGGAAGGASTGKFVGNITTGNQVRSDFALYWNQITPENEGKWGTVEPNKDIMNWAGLDAVYAYTKAHGTLFKQHNFIWGQQQPAWLAPLSAEDQKAQVEQWISLFCARFPDVALIDVVNEPTHNQPVYMNALGGAGSSGYDWVVQALKWAHQYCPSAKLLVNDYNTIEYGADRDNFIELIKAVKAAGAPIDGIGAQGHDAYKLSVSTVQSNVDALATQTGLPVYITELDINEANDATQKTELQSLMTMFEADANVKAITLWGYIVGQTWEANTGLMTASGTMRPAMQWLVSSGYLLK